MQPQIIMSFIPWILFFILFGHTQTSKDIAVLAALASHLLLNYRSIKQQFLLDLGTFAFFFLFTLNVLFFKFPALTNNGFNLGNLVLALIAWISIIVGQPFTLQYARSQVPEEIAISNFFSVINYLLSTIWAIAFTLMLVPAFLEYLHPFAFYQEIDIGIAILLVLFAVWLTQKLPNYLANRMIEKLFKIDIQALYANYQKKVRKQYQIPPATTQPSHNIKKNEVIIIGAGPVGLVSALLLEQYGIRPIIFEKHPGTSTHPKARGISCRSMELFRKLGLSERIRQWDIPSHYRWFGWFESLIGKEYARILPLETYAAISPESEASVSQQYLETILLEAIREKNIEIYFEHKFQAVAKQGEQLFVTVEDLKTKQQNIYECQYLLAADGTRSSVRDFLDIKMIGPEMISTICSLYCEINLDEYIPENRRCSISYIVQPERPAPLVHTIDGKHLWLFMFPSSGISIEKLKELYTDEYSLKKIYEVIGVENIPIKMISKKFWTLGSQIAETANVDGVFLLGDALHRFSPTGGMGMNTGLQDADNLMWKLAYTLQNKTNRNLLATYAEERLPIILKNMQWSLTNLYRILTIQRSLEKDDPTSENFKMVVQTQQSHLNKSGLDLGAIYQSSIIAKDDAPRPEQNPTNYRPIIYSGSRLPHLELLKENQLISSLDLIKDKFILLCEPQGKSFANNINFQKLPTVIYSIGPEGDLQPVDYAKFSEIYNFREYGACWVRPDGHIAWQGNLTDPIDISLLEEVIKKLI